MKITKLWISCPKFTGQINVDNENKIIMTPPVWQRFRGQHYSNLLKWLEKFGSYEIKPL